MLPVLQQQWWICQTPVPLQAAFKLDSSRRLEQPGVGLPRLWRNLHPLGLFPGTSAFNRQDGDIRQRDTPAFTTSFVATRGPLWMYGRMLTTPIGDALRHRTYTSLADLPERKSTWCRSGSRERLARACAARLCRRTSSGCSSSSRWSRGSRPACTRRCRCSATLQWRTRACSARSSSVSTEPCQGSSTWDTTGDPCCTATDRTRGARRCEGGASGAADDSVARSNGWQRNYTRDPARDFPFWFSLEPSTFDYIPASCGWTVHIDYSEVAERSSLTLHTRPYQLFPTLARGWEDFVFCRLKFVYIRW